jgi:hypothetical protein
MRAFLLQAIISGRSGRNYYSYLLRCFLTTNAFFFDEGALYMVAVEKVSKK